jgi:hypothetical protein
MVSNPILKIKVNLQKLEQKYLADNIRRIIKSTLFYISAPDFVSTLEDKDHVYFFFRESAVEHINCGKVG